MSIEIERQEIPTAAVGFRPVTWYGVKRGRS